MKCPNVSIIITNYNYGKYLDRCLRSCLQQKEVEHEIILVDDNSTEDTESIIKPFKDDITYIHNNTNVGVAAASNIGILASKGRFVIRVDGDDFVDKWMCFFMQTYLQNNRDAFCVSCDYLLTDEHEEVKERKYASVDNISCGIMYRKQLLLDFGGYNIEYRHREEEELRSRLGNYYNIHHLGIPFYRYRKHDTNKTLTDEYKNTVI